jgi:hypothetical protein
VTPEQLEELREYASHFSDDWILTIKQSELMNLIEAAEEYKIVGMVSEFGGGLLNILVRRDLGRYPELGTDVYMKGYNVSLI